MFDQVDKAGIKEPARHYLGGWNVESEICENHLPELPWRLRGHRACQVR